VTARMTAAFDDRYGSGPGVETASSVNSSAAVSAPHPPSGHAGAVPISSVTGLARSTFATIRWKYRPGDDQAIR
jgi:hypothetical protein